MEIKSFELHKVNKENSHMKAIGKLELSNGWFIDDLRVIEGDNGLFIAMRHPKNVNEKELLKVLNENTRKMIEETILNKYKEL